MSMERFKEANERREQIDNNDKLAIAIFYILEYPEFATSDMREEFSQIVSKELNRLRTENERLKRTLDQYKIKHKPGISITPSKE